MTNWSGDPRDDETNQPPGAQAYPQYPAEYQPPQYQPGQYQPYQPGQYQPYQPYQPYQRQPYPYGYQPKTNGLGIGGFVCGLLGLVLFWIPVGGLLLAAVGVALSAAGISAGKREHSGTGLAIAGLVLGIIGVIPGLLILIALFSI